MSCKLVFIKENARIVRVDYLSGLQNLNRPMETVESDVLKFKGDDF